MKTLKNNIPEKEISHFYSNDNRLKAVIMEGADCFFVDFYRDDVIIDSRRVTERSLRYAEDLAENFVSGVFRIDSDTWRIHGV